MSTRAARRRPVGAHFDGDLRSVLLAVAAEALADSDADGLSLRDVTPCDRGSHAGPAPRRGREPGGRRAQGTEGLDRFMEAAAPFLPDDARDPVGGLPDPGRAYAEFALDRLAHFRVMFPPALIHADAPAYVA